MAYDVLINVKSGLASINDSKRLSVDCTSFETNHPDVVFIIEDNGNQWVERDPFDGRETDYDQVEAQSIIDAAYAEKASLDTPTLSDLDLAKQNKLEEINNEYVVIMAPYVKTFPDIETKTWPLQEEEARGYIADPTHPTPLLDNILVGRNGGGGTETMQQLAEAVVINSDNFKAIQVNTGHRQRLEKMINDATTVSEVDAIVW